jgi:UrcA family protein
MARRRFFPAYVGLSLLGGAALLLQFGNSPALAQAGPNGPAVAQGDADSPEANEHITIHAPEYVVKRKPISGRQYNLANAEVISVSRAVNYADLNLSKPADVEELKKRITETAKDVCQELNRRYPKSSFQVVVDKDCVKSAVDDAMGVEKQLVIASAK